MSTMHMQIYSKWIHLHIIFPIINPFKKEGIKLSITVLMCLGQSPESLSRGKKRLEKGSWKHSPVS